MNRKTTLYLNLLMVIMIIFLPSISFSQSVYAGGYHFLAICGDSTVKAWGCNMCGQLGNGTDTDCNQNTAQNLHY